MTSNAPVVKIGKEHSHRDGGNQRCFLCNSLSDLGKTTPAAHGKGSSQQQWEWEKESERDRDNKESWKKKAWKTFWEWESRFERMGKGYAVSERNGVKVMERWFNSFCKVLLLCSKCGQRKIIPYNFLYNIQTSRTNNMISHHSKIPICVNKKQLGACSIVFTASRDKT